MRCNQKYDIAEKENIINKYRNRHSIRDICKIYGISKSTLLRWNKKYNGTKESLAYKSTTRRTNVYTIDLRLKVVNLYRLNKISVEDLCRLYKISASSLYRWNKRYDGTNKSLQNKG